MGDVYLERIESLHDLIEVYDHQIRHCDAFIHRRLQGHPGYEAIQTLRRVGPVLAAVFVAEIGDVHRFATASQLCSLGRADPPPSGVRPPRPPRSDRQEGSRLLRWATVEAASGVVRDPQITAVKRRIGDRRGRNIVTLTANTEHTTDELSAARISDRSTPASTRSRS